MVTVVVLVFLLWCVVGGVIGRLIGARKGNGTAGFWLGFFLGWIGWVIAAVMGPTIDNEVARASALAAARDGTSGAVTATAYGVSSGFGARPLGSVTPLGSRRVSLDVLRDAARSDLAWSDLEPSVRALETMPGAPPTVWFFADGLYNVVARRDGVIFLCRDSEVRRASPRAAVLFDVDDTGAAVAVNVDGFELKAPRPTVHVGAFLSAAQARQRRVVAAAPPPPPPPPPPLLEGRRAAAALDELAQLLDGGLVTADEYAAKRREILDRI